MNIENVDIEDLEDEWVKPKDVDGFITLKYHEYPDGKIYGYWVCFSPEGMGSDYDTREIFEFKKVVTSKIDIGEQLNDTDIELAWIAVVNSDAMIYVDSDFDEQVERSCYFMYIPSVSEDLIYKIPCYRGDDGEYIYVYENYNCETYKSIDLDVIGFE